MAAREKVRIARALEQLPMIDAAFAQNQLSYSKVRALTRVASRENEVYLLALARSASASQLERIVRDQMKLNRGRPEVSSTPELALYPVDNGDWIIKDDYPKFWVRYSMKPC